MPVSLVTITNCHYTSICNQVCYVIWHLEMVWLLNYSFIQVDRLKADMQFKVSWLVLAFNQDKTVYARSCLCHWLKYTHLDHLVYLLFKVTFKWMGIGLQGVCLGCTFGSRCMLSGGPRNFPIPSKTSGYCAIIWSLLVINLLGCCFLIWLVSTCCLLWITTCCNLCTDGWACLVF